MSWPYNKIAQDDLAAFCKSASNLLKCLEEDLQEMGF